MSKVLIVEDELSIAELEKDYLELSSFEVEIETDGQQGLEKALKNDFDMIILDIMLPYIDGFQILKEIRDNDISAKVIMLTAKSELEDKLNGFQYGADDYLTKPFHIEELVVRVNVQLRKDNNQKISDYIDAYDIRLNIKTSTLSCISTEESIDVGCKEFLILEYLIQNQNIIISKDQIYDQVWGIDNNSESNNLEAYLSFIRKKLKIIGSKINIKAIRGLGYKLEGNHEETKK